jgi:hypothetical protein
MKEGIFGHKFSQTRQILGAVIKTIFTSFQVGSKRMRITWYARSALRSSAMTSLRLNSTCENIWDATKIGRREWKWYRQPMESSSVGAGGGNSTKLNVNAESKVWRSLSEVDAKNRESRKFGAETAREKCPQRRMFCYSSEY